jgi:hypothetical protein
MKMPSSGMLRHVSELDIASTIRVKRIREAICSSETSILTRATRRHIPEDGILHKHIQLTNFVFSGYLELRMMDEDRTPTDS